MKHLAIAAALLFVATDAAARPPAPPVARRVPHPTVHHGDELSDDYFWLRDKKDPAVRAYLEAEDRYAVAMMKPTAALQQRLYREMLGRIQETDSQVPYRMRGWTWTTRTEKGKQYEVMVRRKTLETPEEVVLDGNALAAGKPFFAVADREVSDDGDLMAYATDDVGFRQYTLRIKDLRTGALAAETAPRVTSIAWAADGKTLFYTQETEDSKRSSRLYRHTLGEPAAKDALVYEEPDARFSVYIERSRSLRYLVMAINSRTTSEIRVLPAATPAAAFTTVVPRRADVEASLDHAGELFYILINDTGRNFRLVSAPVADPRPEAWKELVPHRPDVMLEDLDIFATFRVVIERAAGQPRIVVTDSASGASHTVALPDPIYQVSGEHNRELDARAYRFRYESLTTPPTTYDYDPATRKLELLKREPVPGYDPAAYQSDRIMAPAPDGTMIPVSLVWKKGIARDGKGALLLRGYGAYGYASDVDFRRNDVSLLDRGVTVGIAHIRGGGELGKPWHDAGRMMNKMNSFTDFIACAEKLVHDGWTTPSRLVIEGRSAGGLLMGAVTNLRPDLFKAVLAGVPFVDVMNTMLDEKLPLTVEEFEEWGNPQVAAEYAAMRKYSPYDNVAAKAYPAMLVKTGWNDSQVMYWEPAKWVARLRATKTDANPLLFKVTFAAGHGGASGRYDHLREAAFDDAFILWQMGIGK